MNIELIKEKLDKLAKQEAKTDEEGFNVYDYSGGNINDAYDLGYLDGQILLARELLDMFKS